MTGSEPLGAGSRRSLLVRIGMFSVLVAALAVAILHLIPGSGQRLDHLREGWVAAAALAEAAACGAYVDLFAGVFAAPPWPLGAWRSTQIGLGELAAFVVVPTGVGGPALRVWALLRSGTPFAPIVARSVVHAALLNLPFAVAAALLGLAEVSGLGPGHAPTLVALAPLALVVAAAGIALGAARYARTRGPAAATGWQRFTQEAAAAIPGGLRQIPAALRRPRLVAAGLGYWVGDGAVLVLAFAALHASPGLGVISLAYLLGQLGNALPLPGGVGGVEPLMLGVLSASGVDLGLGGAAVLLYRIMSLGLQTTLGTVAVATLVPALTRTGGAPLRPSGAEAGRGTPSGPGPTRP